MHQNELSRFDLAQKSIPDCEVLFRLFLLVWLFVNSWKTSFPHDREKFLKQRSNTEVFCFHRRVFVFLFLILVRENLAKTADEENEYVDNVK
jgi:hypothetical protein